MGISLKWVLVSYSTIFGLWFYGLYILIAHLWKSPKEALILILALCLTMRYKHYAGHTEITFAIAVATTLFAWILVDKSKLLWCSNRVDWVIKTVFILWLYIIHPIIIVPLGIILAIDFVLHKRWNSLNHLLFLVLLFSSFILRFMTVANDSYETGKISVLSKAQEVFTNPEQYYVFNIIKGYFDKEYHVIMFFFLCCLVILLFNKKIIPALGLLLGSIFLLALVIVTYSYLRGDLLLMIDGYLGMLGMIIGYGIYLASNEIKSKMIFTSLIGVLIIFCLFRIQSKSKFMSKRLQYYSQTFELYPGKNKLFALLVLHDWDKMWYPYEIPLETLMLSALQGKQYSKTIFIDYNQKNLILKYPQTDVFYLFDGTMNINQLNPKFFHLNPEEKYQKIEKVAWK
jgi:hypothetical protein